MNITLDNDPVDNIPVDFDPFAGPEISLIAPASESQLEIWTSCLIGGDDANRAYNESASLLLTGIFDKSAMTRALQGLVNRHQSLRTAFSADGKNICVFKDLQLDVEYKDLSDESVNEQQDYIRIFNKRNALTTLNLVTGPLFKCSILKLSKHEHLLTLNAHHIICDGWSIGILMQDLSKLYSGYAKHEPLTLPPAPAFSDFAFEQTAAMDSPDYQETRRYWISQFKESNHILDLPTDYQRPAFRTYKSQRIDVKLSASLASKIKKLGKDTGSSFVTTLLAAFEVFLQKLTGQEEVIIGLPSAGQPATGNFRLVGHCVNLLALRSCPKGHEPFSTYLKKRRSDVLDAYEHQLYTFGSLLKALNIPRDPTRIPLVPVMFNIDMGLDDDVRFYNLNHKLISNPREFENFELFLNIAGNEEAPTFEWSYNTQLFKAKSIRVLMNKFEYLLGKIVEAPDTLIADIPQANEVELALQQTARNNTRTVYPYEKALHQLIDSIADEHPQNIALKCGSQAVTYLELQRQSNRLAALLIEKEVKKGDKVAVAVERSAEMVIALLAVMKAGGVYVPLDPQFPLERIKFMLTDSEAVMLITSKDQKEKYESAARVLVLEEEWENITKYDSAAPAITVGGDDLIYILYTSGSTGVPKGVQVSHRNMVNFLCSMQDKPGITINDKLLAVTTISFDISGLEMFLPLATGAQAYIAGSAQAKDGNALLQIVKDEGITLMQATPYTWRIMIEAGWDHTNKLKVICGGEALPLELAQRLLKRSSSLWNVYGPTETTIWSTIKHITVSDKVITIGKPVNNTTVYILDKNLKILAPGVAGEIFIGGDGVAKGYFNRPQLNYERFIDDPFANEPGQKMYCTGDLGKFTSDGEIECLGRMDSQVKIRGYRIETGEIEYQLSQQPDIREAIVMARPDQFGIDKLVAFIVVNYDEDVQGPPGQHSRWRGNLRQVLPEYMLPDNFLEVPALPLTPNGKVDKKALLKFSIAQREEGSGFIAPRTDVEKMVADIWIDALGLKKVGVHDNFFELGGHSLIAVQVMSKIEKETGKRLPLATLFECSTVEKLAQLINLDGKAVSWDSLVPIKPGGSKMPLYMVHGAGLNVLLFNTLAMGMSEDQPVYGLQAKGLDGIDEPLKSIEEIAAHYIAAIKEQNPYGPYALAGYSFGGIIAYEMARQMEASGKEVKMLAMFDTYAYRSPYYDAPLTKYYKRGKFLMRRIAYALKFTNGFKSTITDKGVSVKRKLTRLYWKFKYGDDQSKVGLFGYSNRVDEMNEYAERHYQLQPYNIKVDLFRAVKRTFYMDDFENLGWIPYAQKGVKIHDIPGEHNTIFKAPNNRVFAEVLQKCLDEAVK